ncbi:SNF2 helicase associated domain-containing protein [Clostridium diolis]|uniref:SNF2 helicase associated domain-containing protein n=1 Tax=Clostridium diolis TaxID=223919 RepID=UPI0026D6CE5F
MKLNELKLIILESSSNVMKVEGENAFKNGLVTNFKSKKIDNIYHIYGIVKDKSKLKEFNTHIKIDLQKKKLEEATCSCDKFKELTSSEHTLMCIHITATAYKFFSVLSNDKKEACECPERQDIERYKILGNTNTTRLIRKTENGSIYYEVQTSLRNGKLMLKPNELKLFLECVENRKIKFKFDYMEFTVPILHKDLPLTFNLKEDNEFIVLTTHKKIPIPLNSNNDVYYFRNELYLPSKNQIKNYVTLREKLKSHGKIVYRKNIHNYTGLISILSNISENINIEQNLINFASNLLKPEFFIFEENGSIYCDVFLRYGSKKVNILSEDRSTDAFIRNYKKEERIIMEVEKKSFLKIKNRFMFRGKDEELFNILSKSKKSIHSLGMVTLGDGFSNRKIYNSTSIKADLYEMDGYYDFVYSIGVMGKSELKSSFDAYKAKDKFYKTRNNDFLDFGDDNVRSFFNVLDVLNINQELEYGIVKMEKIKALYLYKSINNIRSGFIKSPDGLTELEDKLSNINNNNISLPNSFKGTLREYQINGVKWFKTLSEIGFGGILADEIGLGKIIQTIAFILSEPNKKTFIVCPTSLIYKWKEKLEKFAPSLNVLIAHGPERIKAINNNIVEFDVILTTYGTLRMDIDYYNDIIFDYCIIDEEQNIKNATAQNTKIIRKIKAKARFALIGSPIEKNLTELWSIFDYIMPGYLYSKEKFWEKFIQRKVDNLESLKLLIKPFILRRTRKEVIRELPNKINKKLLV